MNLVRWDEAFALHQVGDDRELLQELVEIFKESFAADCSVLKQGVAENSDSQIEGALHSIKGAAANLGFKGIAGLAAEIEEGSDHIALTSKALPTFENMLNEIRKM